MKQASEGKLYFGDFRDTLGVEVVWGRQVRHDFGRHTHRTLCVGVVEAGVRILECRGERYEVAPGQVFVIPPGQAHACGAAGGPHSYRLFLISPDVLSMALAPAAGGRCVFTGLVVDDEKRFKEWLSLHDVLLGAETAFFKQASLVSALGGLLECCAAISEDSPISDRHYEGVRGAQAFIEKHYGEALSLGDIAKSACLSPYYLIRVFSRIVGIPPHIYQQQVRVRLAKEMLAQGTPLVEVALRTGFADQSHFTNVFKKMMGLTPGEYAKSLSANSLRPE